MRPAQMSLGIATEMSLIESVATNSCFRSGLRAPW